MMHNALIWATIVLLILAIASVIVKIFMKPRGKTISTTTETSGGNTTQEKKEKKSWGTWAVVIALVIAIFLACSLTWRLTSSHEQEKARIAITKKPAVNKIIKFDYYWKLDNGQYIHGQNEAKPSERTVELVKFDENHFYLDQQYVQCGSPQTARFRMQKTGDKLWEGTFEQDYPEEHGRITLHETTQGIYSGKQTWSDGKTAFCTFQRK
jgi:NADH:ubiquinone oxidoreductase subunit 5 (subunit L)/multisubunit Na+/H+ antiporter MnhA subunit